MAGSNNMLMEASWGLDPCRAGSCLIPPYIAGRDKEIRVLRKTLDSIKGCAGQMGCSTHPVLVLLKWSIENTERNMQAEAKSIRGAGFLLGYLVLEVRKLFSIKIDFIVNLLFPAMES